MKHLKTNEEFAQEVLRRGQIYKRKRRSMIMSVSACLLVVFACAAVYAVNADGSLPRDSLSGRDDMTGQYYADEMDGDANDFAEEIAEDQITQEIYDTSVAEIYDNEMNEMPEATQLPEAYAEIYCTTDMTVSYASIIIPDSVSEISQLIEEAKANGITVDAYSETESAEVYYTIMTHANNTIQSYVLGASILYDENNDIAYKLSPEDTNKLREKLDAIMKGR